MVGIWANDSYLIFFIVKFMLINLSYIYVIQDKIKILLISMYLDKTWIYIAIYLDVIFRYYYFLQSFIKSYNKRLS